MLYRSSCNVFPVDYSENSATRESPTYLVERKRPTRVVPTKTGIPGYGRLGEVVLVGGRDNVIPDISIHVPLDGHDHGGIVVEVKSADAHAFL